MSRWFRMYADVLDDPKVQRLPPDLFKAWVNLLCLACRGEGALPPVEDIAFALRVDENVTRDIIRDLSQRGLLDDCDGLTPHNWSERQFKSDGDSTAAERKRKQREREKEREKQPVTPPVTPDVTRDITDTSHPSEQSRTEQSRAEQSARAPDPDHWKVVQDYLKDRTADLDTWEVDFLHSIKWALTLTAKQRDSFKAIRSKLDAKGATGQPRALPSVSRGTPAYDAWVAYYRKQNGGRKTYHEGRDSFTVPSEFPPEEKAA